jgi:hypothetical protein
VYYWRYSYRNRLCYNRYYHRSRLYFLSYWYYRNSLRIDYTYYWCRHLRRRIGNAASTTIVAIGIAVISAAISAVSIIVVVVAVWIVPVRRTVIALIRYPVWRVIRASWIVIVSRSDVLSWTGIWAKVTIGRIGIVYIRVSTPTIIVCTNELPTG